MVFKSGFVALLDTSHELGGGAVKFSKIVLRKKK